MNYKTSKMYNMPKTMLQRHAMKNHFLETEGKRLGNHKTKFSVEGGSELVQHFKIYRIRVFRLRRNNV